MPDLRITGLTLGTPATDAQIPYTDGADTLKTTPAGIFKAADYFEINYIIGNAGTTAISQTGLFPPFRVNRAGTILGAEMYSGTIAGNATVQVFKGNYDSPPSGTAQNIIGGGSSMVMTGASKYQATTSAWTTKTFGSGDVFAPYLVGAGTIAGLSIVIHCKGI